MKTTCIYLCFLLLVIACRKKAGPWSPHWGTQRAVVNGQPWSYAGWTVKIALTEVTYPSDPSCNTLQLIIRQFNGSGHLRQSLIFSNITPVPGTYPVAKDQHCRRDATVGANFATYDDDGDVAQDYYAPSGAAVDYVAVTAYDARTEEIRGTYGVIFLVNNWSLAPSDFPDTVRFTTGEFHTRIVRRK